MSALTTLAEAQQGKALAYHPALANDGTPVEILDLGSGGARKRGRLTQREAPRHINAYGGQNDAVDWVMDCVRLYTDGASSASWFLEEKGERLHKERTDKLPKDAKLGPKALYDLLESPNPYMDYEELIELLVIDLLLVGNAYWFKWRTNEKGQPLALYRLAPPFVKVIPSDLGPAGYEYTVPGSGQRKPLQIPLSDMIHFKLPNPHSPYYGLGIVQGGGRPLDLELALTDHQASYYEKGTNPSMIVQSDRRVPKDVFKKLQMQLRNRYGGPRHAGELMVLEAGLKATTITPNAMEAAFASLSKLSRDRVFAMFRVPPKLLGISDEAGGNDKSTDFQRVFDTKTMQPFMEKLQRRVTRALTQAWDVDFVIDYRYQMPKEDQVKLAGDFSKIPGVTVREVREFLELPPTGDDSIDDLVLNLPGDSGVPGATRNGFPDQPLPGEGGRPPNGNNTTAFGTVGGGARPDLVAGSRARRPSEKGAQGKSLDEIQARLDELAGKAVTLQTPKPASTGRYLDSADVPDLIADERSTEIDALTATTVAEIRDAVHTLERGLLDHVEGKALNDLRSRVRRSEAWTGFRAALAAILERSARRGASSAAALHSTIGLDAEIDYDKLTQDIVYRKGGVNQIVNNFRDAVAKNLATTLKEGGDRKELEAAIRASMDTWRDGHAETVAMTEAVHAFNEATLAVAEANGATTVRVTDGHDDDEPCIQADGATWDIDFAREHRLEHPRCRRAFLPILPVASQA